MKTCPVCGTSYDDASAFCPADGTTLIVADRSGDLIGSVIADRYLVLSLLGEGGMGRVYLARHVRLPQQAAIKVLHPGMISDPDAVSRFNREAANAARIEHDRVARVFDFGEMHDGAVYLAMEYVPGRTLRAILEDERRLPPVRAASLTYQVAEGLDAAHRIGIVHRDLKPDNVMVVTDDAGVDRCKVVDFGIAKARDGGTQARLTRTGTVVGTPEYMSPEQVVGEAVEATSDVYALALVAYHMFTGELPFSSNTPERAFAVRLIEDPRPLATAAPEVEWPTDLQAAFDRALDRDPATRTSTALEFAEAVVVAVEGWTGSSVLRARTPLSSRAVTPPSLTVVPAAGSTGSGIGTVPRQAQPSASVPNGIGAAGTPKPPSRRGSRGPALAIAGAVALGAVLWVVTRGSESRGAVSVPVATSTVAERLESPDSGPPPPVVSGKESGRRGDGARLAPTLPPTAAPAPGAEQQAARVDPPPAPPVLGATSPAVLTTLDSLRRVLEDSDTGEAEARAAVPALQRLMRSMTTPGDSTWTWLALVSAYGQSGDAIRSCNALRSAARQASTANQRAAIATFFDNTSCVR